MAEYRRHFGSTPDMTYIVTSPLPTSNDTSQNDTCRPNDAVTLHNETAQLVVTFVLFVLIVIGNACVIAAIMSSKTGRRSRMNFFILNLAAVDLAAAFFGVLPDAVLRAVGFWYAGVVMCKIVEFLKQTVAFASTYVLVALSIDRLDAIARPMSFGSSGKRAKILIAIAWITSVVFSLPSLYLYDTHVYPCTDVTWCNNLGLTTVLHFQIYITTITAVLFIIPTVTIATCYAVIIHVIWSKSKVMTTPSSTSRGSGKWLRDHVRRLTRRSTKNGEPMLSESLTSNPSCTDASHSSSRGVIPQAKIRTIKMTLVIVTAFVFCWSPFFVIQMMLAYSYHVPMAVSVMGQSLGVLNNLANPIVYGIFSTRVCTNLREIRVVNWLLNKICCCLCKPAHDKRRNGHYDHSTTTDYLSTTESPHNHGQRHDSIAYHSVGRSSSRGAFKSTTQM